MASESFRYFEGLDSVRLSANEIVRPATPVQTHTELGILSSLLLGERVVLSENQGFDSFAFTQLASRVVGDAAFWSPAARPFELKLPYWETVYSTYRGMIAARLRDANYYLSSPELARAPSALRELADLILKGDWEKTVSRNFLTDSAAETFSNLDRYFGNQHLSRASEPQLKLAQAVGAIIDDIPPVHEAILRADNTLELLNAVRQIGAVLSRFASWFATAYPDHPLSRDPFSARSPFHEKMHEFASACGYDEGGHAIQLAREFLDSAYNRVLAESVGANSVTFTVEERNLEWSRAGAELAAVVASRGTGAPIVSESFGSDSSFDTARVDWIALWREVRDILQNPEFIRRRNSIRSQFEFYDARVRSGEPGHLMAYAVHGRAHLFHEFAELAHEYLHTSPISLRFDGDESALWTEVVPRVPKVGVGSELPKALRSRIFWQAVRLVPTVGQVAAEVGEAAEELLRPIFDHSVGKRRASTRELSCGWQALLRTPVV